MTRFQHFITTTFNVPASNWSKTRDGKTALSEEWFTDRIEIFGKYCLPSFQNQSCKNFEWLVFFDENTPAFYKENIRSIQEEFPPLQPIFVKDIADKKGKLLENIKIRLRPDTDYIITTDIDNDDILHRDFVKTVQSKFQPIHHLVIDLRKGLQLTKKSTKQGFFTDYYSAGNPFVSLVESTSADYKTVTHYIHHETRNFKDISVYDGTPMFIQFIHDYNMMNATSDFKRFGNIRQDEFGIPKENEFTVSQTETAIFNLKRYLKLLKARYLK